MPTDRTDLETYIAAWIDDIRAVLPGTIRFQYRDADYDAVCQQMEDVSGIAKGVAVYRENDAVAENELLFEPYDDGAAYVQTHVPEEEVAEVKAVGWTVEHGNHVRSSILAYAISSSFNGVEDTVTCISPHGMHGQEVLQLADYAESYIAMNVIRDPSNPG